MAEGRSKGTIRSAHHGFSSVSSSRRSLRGYSLSQNLRSHEVLKGTPVKSLLLSLWVHVSH